MTHMDLLKDAVNKLSDDSLTREQARFVYGALIFYTDYTNSDEIVGYMGSSWLHVTTKIKQLWNNKCACCSRPSKATHHNTYENVNSKKQNEEFTDLIPLCVECHDAIHKIHGGTLKKMVEEPRVYHEGSLSFDDELQTFVEEMYKDLGLDK